MMNWPIPIFCLQKKTRPSFPSKDGIRHELRKVNFCKTIQPDSQIEIDLSRWQFSQDRRDILSRVFKNLYGFLLTLPNLQFEYQNV